MRDYYYFPKAAPRPRAAPGKERKKFGETWWGRQWVDILSKYEGDQRMSRGRAYARANKVKKFKLDKGNISASVIGSLGTYKVNIAFKKHSDKNWKSIAEAIRNTPLLLGKLLNNEMPQEIEEATGFEFIPRSFSSDCSCPDYANPCKHIAAVFYTIADEIDHNPMSLLLLHGMETKELFSRLEMVEDAPPDNTKIADKEHKRKARKGKSKNVKPKKRKNIKKVR